MQATLAETPVFETDLFLPETLRAPYGHYRALRDMGPLARLRDPDIYVLARFDGVHDALRASDTLVSGQGVGFSPAFNTWRGPNLLSSDGDMHQRMKTEVLRPLLPGQLRRQRPTLKAMISDRIRALVGTGEFDAMAAIARLLPTMAISVLVGLEEAGRARMLDWAAATFNALGPPRPEFAADAALLNEARDYIAVQERDTVKPGSWAQALFDARDAGRLSEAEAKGALSAYIIPSLDTTILSKGNLLFDLATNPDQWRKLKADPSLIPAAIIEGVRHNAVVRWFSRMAVRDYPVGGELIPEGARVMLIYGSVNRDERRFPDPDRFDIARDARAQLAWGTGTHMCGGMHLARLEMEGDAGGAGGELLGDRGRRAGDGRQPRPLRLHGAAAEVARLTPPALASPLALREGSGEERSSRADDPHHFREAARLAFVLLRWQARRPGIRASTASCWIDCYLQLPPPPC